MQKTLLINGEEVSFNIIKQDGEYLVLDLEGHEYIFDIKKVTKNEYSIQQAGENHSAFIANDHIVIGGTDFIIESPRSKKARKKAQGDGNMQSPMPGKILKYMVKAGEKVEKGSPLLVMEAMKMEHTIKASSNGKIEKLLYQEGELVDGGVDLVAFLADEGE